MQLLAMKTMKKSSTRKKWNKILAIKTWFRRKGMKNILMKRINKNIKEELICKTRNAINAGSQLILRVMMRNK